MKVWQFILTMIGLAAVFALGLLISNALLIPRLVHRYQEVRVPDMMGLAVDGARELAQASALTVEVVREESHPVAPVGSVIGQNPESGHTVRAGRNVALVLSGGPPAGHVPLLDGLSRLQAETTLQRESYLVGRILHMRRSDGLASSVALQFPAAGTRMRKGIAVDMVVADPPHQSAYLMPDLRGQALYVARQAVEQSGCVTAPVRYERDRDVPHGTVLDQTPAPGARILKGETIELVASTR